jgi:hypothetical protein
MVYIGLFILLALLAPLDLVNADQQATKRKIFYGVILLLILLSSIRWETGPDWDSYHNFYTEIDQFVAHPETNFFEPGFTAINYSFHWMGLPYSVLLTFFAIITIGLKSLVFMRHGRMLFILLFLYFSYYLADVLSVRQFMAVSINLFAFTYIERRKLLPFLLLTALSVSIHIASLLFFLAYWIYHIRLTNRTMILALCTSLLLGLIDFTTPLIELFARSLGIDSVFIDKVLRYGEEGLDTSHANPYISYALGVLKRSFILPLLFLGRKWVKPIYLDRYQSYLQMLVVGNLIYFVFILTIPVITRLALPFLYMEIFLLGYLVISVKDWHLKVGMIAALILFGAFRLYLFMLPYMDLYQPFQTIFTQKLLYNRF